MILGEHGCHIPETYDELVSLTVFCWMKIRDDDVIEMALDRLFTREYGIEFIKSRGKTEDDFVDDVSTELSILKGSWGSW